MADVAVTASNPEMTRLLRRRSLVNKWTLLLVPGLAFLGVFYVNPIVRMGIRSFTDPSPANYKVFFQQGFYQHVLWTTFKTAGIVTGMCILLGYPYAYYMHHAGPRMRVLLGGLVLIPLWSSLLVRTYAWTVLLQYTGVINTVLMKLGLIDQPLTLMRNTLGVTIGMTHILLPVMVLPIYAAMRRIEPELMAAARAAKEAGPLTSRSTRLPGRKGLCAMRSSC